MSLAVRTLRHIGLDRNPLRRTVDRIEAWITVGLIVTFLLVVPATAWLTGRAVYSAGVHTEQVEQAHRYRAQAVLLADPGSASAPEGMPPQRGAAPLRTGSSAGVRAPARWTAADGTEHRGAVLADERARAGQWMAVWTDSRGNLTDPPQQRVQTYINAVAAAVLAGVGAALMAGMVRMLICRALDARRMAQWEAAWWQFEPRWTGRS